MQKVDFKVMSWYAERAAMAYESEEDIREAFPNTTLVNTTSNNVQYFIEHDAKNKRQIVSVRGTDNLANAREDAEYVQSKNGKLGIWVHSGFDEDTLQIFQEILPHLDKSNEIILTGHSLGAAISTLLMMYLHEEGFSIGTSMNFGQPKLTNSHGVKKYRFLPLLRVVDENDLVPLVPPIDLIDAIHGGYEHLGTEVILLGGEHFVFLEEHDAERKSVGSFWRNLGNESVEAHYIKHYQHNITNKFDGAVQVPYKDRKKYYDH